MKRPLSIALLFLLSTSLRSQEDFHYPFEEGYFEWQLSQYDLEPLQKDGSIRFLWLRSFHPAIVFELQENSESLDYEAKVWKDEKWSTYSKKEIDEEDNRLVTILELELSGFFQTQSFKKEDLKYTDAAAWIFEAKMKDKHNWIWKQSPSEETNEGRWGKAIIEESIDSPAVPIY